MHSTDGEEEKEEEDESEPDQFAKTNRASKAKATPKVDDRTVAI